MKNVLLFILFILIGCSPQRKVIRKHPQCQKYIKYISENWERKQNGFYILRDIKDPALNEWQQLEAPPFFYTQWKTYSKKCINQFTEDELLTRSRHLCYQPLRIYLQNSIPALI